MEHYRRLAQRLGLAADVLFTGMVPFADAPRHVALGDVAVAPKLSATEGSGKLLTYMASALPVVAFDTPVHREYLGDLGFYAAPADSHALAAALTAALHDPLAARTRGAALRARAVQHYTWPHAAAAIEDVYHRVSSPPAQPPPETTKRPPPLVNLFRRHRHARSPAVPNAWF
ncbi:MAG: glycosyltransferase [Anaerolineae bacterium]|nr:glycosyltransferase [Anaerolineae bacterium]